VPTAAKREAFNANSKFASSQTIMAAFPESSKTALPNLAATF